MPLVRVSNGGSVPSTVGEFTASSSASYSVVGLGFKPKFLLVRCKSSASGSASYMFMYSEDWGTTKYYRILSDGFGLIAFSSSANCLQSINSNGFTVAKQSARYCDYYAWGELPQ